MSQSSTNAPPDSPCIKVCVVDLETGYCIGCGRSGDEIAAWTGLTGQEKRELVEKLPQRLRDITAKRRRKGGRRARRKTEN